MCAIDRRRANRIYVGNSQWPFPHCRGRRAGAAEGPNGQMSIRYAPGQGRAVDRPARSRRGPAADAPAPGAGGPAVRQGRPPPVGGGTARGGAGGWRAGVAGHRLQHAAPVHRGGHAAHPRRRGIEDLLRHQHLRPPSFLHRRREPHLRHRGRPGEGGPCPSRPRAWKSPTSRPAAAAGGHGDRPSNVDIVVRPSRYRATAARRAADPARSMLGYLAGPALTCSPG